jgi:hypothetical protein
MSDENIQPTDSPKPSITLQDIASVVEILRVVTERGVWRVAELSSVGQVYDRLVAFLEAAGVSVKTDDKTSQEDTTQG